MPFEKKVFILFLFFLYKFSVAGNLQPYVPVLEIDRAGLSDLAIVIIENDLVMGNCLLEVQQKRPNPLLSFFRAKQKKNKRVIATLLAFPLPFGIVGLHRIYLGCAPYVPVAYIASLGGVFGVLPFIDFCVLLLDKDLEHYTNSKKIFMWVH